MSTNTLFRYLYRDADNYKEWGQVVLGGPPSPEYEKRIRQACLPDGLFVAQQIGIPTVYLFGDGQGSPTVADHGYHQFWGLETTDEAVTDEDGRFIEDLVLGFEEIARDGWNVVEPGDFIWA